MTATIRCDNILKSGIQLYKCIFIRNILFYTKVQPIIYCCLTLRENYFCLKSNPISMQIKFVLPQSGRMEIYMWFFALFAAFCAAVFIQYRVYRKKGLESFTYTVHFSSDEAEQGDYIYLYERLVNNKNLPLPYLRVDTDLPEGLSFILTEKDNDTGAVSHRSTSRIQSVFAMRGGTEIERRWRISCDKRGEYELSGAIIVVRDQVGLLQLTKRLDKEEIGNGHLTVLPHITDIVNHYSSSMYSCGDLLSNHSLTTDALRLCGTREYSIYDPMSKINWMSTASHGKLMVNIEEKNTRTNFSVILSMSSRSVERIADKVSDEAALERQISVCAALFDMMSVQDIPIDFYVNTPSNPYLESYGMKCVDEGGKSGILKSPVFCGKRQLADALRILSAIQPEISIPTEKLIDSVLSNTDLYRSSRYIVMVCAYIDERMINFHALLKREGINVIFYVTTTRRDTSIYPEDIELYYKTY